MTSIRLLLAPLAFAAPLATACGHDAPSVPQSAIAVVGDRAIARAEYDALMTQAKQSYTTSGRPFPAAGTPAYEHLKHVAVELLVEQAELEQEAPELGVHIDGAQVAARLRDLKDQSFGGSEKRYRERLKAAGMTDGQVRAAIRTQLISDAVREAVTADVAIGTQAVKRYYETNLRAYTTPRARAVRHILVRSRAAAERVYARVRAGEPLGALARRFSIDPRTKDRGGAFTIVAGRTAPQLDRVAFSLSTGRVSAPFPTRFGWEVIQAAAAIRPARVTPLASVRSAIQKTLLSRRRSQVYRSWLTGLRHDYERRTVYAHGFSPPA